MNSAKTPEGVCVTCPTGNILTTVLNLINGKGTEGTAAAILSELDFTPDAYTSPELLASDLAELTAPTTFADLLRLGCNDGGIQSVTRAGKYALALLGQSSAETACSGPIDGRCPVRGSRELLEAFTDAFAVHILRQPE